MLRICFRRLIYPGVALVVASLATSPAGADGPAARTVVHLGVAEPDVSQPHADGGLLLREIVRQAVLIAARDELHLPTHDAVLREPVAAGAEVLAVRTAAARGGSLEVTVERGQTDKREVVWRKEIPLPAEGPIDYHRLVTDAQQLARTEIAAALRKAGYEARPATTSLGVADPSADKAIDSMTLTGQFAALRALHQPVPPAGEAARLGALVRAYAHLGQLTAFHWSPAHKAFKARALLYADRLVGDQPAAPAAHWHRAYARALAGFPAAALASLAEAEKLRAAMPDDRRPEPPGWVGLIDAFAHRDFARLAAAGRPGRPDAPLASLLAYLTLEEEGRNTTFVQFARKVAQTYPEVFRYYDGILGADQLGEMHVAAAAGPEALATMVPAGVAELPGLPSAVRQTAVAGVADEVATGAVPIAKALVEAGRADPDAGEPSWAVLGRLLQELQFAQACRTGKLQRQVLGWSADDVKDFVRKAMPAVADHPYQNYVVAFSTDPRRQAEAYRGLLQAVPLADLEPTVAPLVTALTTVDTANRAPGKEATRLMRLHLDATADDLAEHLPTRAAKDRPAAAREFLLVSPHSPQPVVALIETDWETVRDWAAAWEAEFAGSPSVLGALGRKYAALQQYPDAERCLKALVRLSPDRAGYQSLANVYKDQGNLDRWKETLDDYLKTENLGLAHAQVRVELARHFIAKKQFDKAKPYADAAAETAAAWAMLCAADVEEGLQNWTATEKWVRETAEHYGTSRQTWLFWCVRTGRGDLDGAQKLALGWAEQNRGTRDSAQLLNAAACFVLCGKADEAFLVLQPLLAGPSVDRQVGMVAAALADELGKTKERDALLAAVAKRADAPPPAAGAKAAPKAAAPGRRPVDPAVQAKQATMFAGCGRLAKLFQAALAGPTPTDVDRKQIDDVIAAVDPDYQVTIQYLAGRFLQLHGRPAEAVALYQAAVAAPNPRSLSAVLAAFRLRAMKG